MDYSPPRSSVHGVLQAGILEWVATLSSRGSFDPVMKPASLTSSAPASRFFTTSATWEAHTRQCRYVTIYEKLYIIKLIINRPHVTEKVSEQRSDNTKDKNKQKKATHRKGELDRCYQIIFFLPLQIT